MKELIPMLFYLPAIFFLDLSFVFCLPLVAFQEISSPFPLLLETPLIHQYP